MVIYAYSGFYKRKNSTLRPSGNGTAYDVYFKENCSIANPTFIIDGVDTTINYIKWNSGSWDRYYFVTDIVLQNNNIYEVSCTIDYLATFKNDIGNTEAFISYCEDSPLTMIIDERLTQRGASEHYARTGTEFSYLKDNDLDGCYIMTFAGLQSATSEAPPYVTPYILSRSGVQNVLSDMWTGSIQQKLKEEFNGTVDCIVSLKWLPLHNIYSAPGTSLGFIYVGTQQIGNTTVAYSIPPMKVIDSSTITINPPFNDFRQFRPFSQWSLYLPFLGVIEVNPADWISDTSIRIEAVIDIMNGTITYRLYSIGNYSEQITKGIYTTNIGKDIPIAAANFNKSKTIANLASSAIDAMGNGLASTVLGGLTGNLIGDATAFSKINLVNLMQNAWTVTPSMIGSYEGVSMEVFGLKPKLFITTHDLVEETDSYKRVLGKPFMNTSYINTHSGYIQCNNASVNCDGFDTEKEIINSYLNSGFYYE